MVGTGSSSGPELYYEETGAGRPILLVHPAGATASTWGAAVDELAQLGRVIAYDRRGYRRSGGKPVGSIAEHTSDAIRLLEQVHGQGAVVIGTSVGATISLDLARQRPDLVHAVVAHESPWHVTRHPPKPAQIKALARMGWLKSRGRYAEAASVFLRFAYTYRDGASAWDSFPDEWRTTALENAEVALDDITIAVGAYPSRKQLAAIRRPVWCTCGERSTSTIVAVTRTLAGVIPTATFHQIPGAGHAVAFDAPVDFVKVVAEAVAAA